MRSSAQSVQRYPLTLMLGTEANLRLLRELSRHGGQLSAPALVARTGLAKTSVWAGLAQSRKSLQAKFFYDAEGYHQDYARRHPDDLYIVYYDAPKVEHLKQQFPELYR